MAGGLSGQVAIVTGGGRGIGRGIAEGLAAAGAAVAVVARSRDQLDETVARVADAGGRAVALPADVTDRAAVERVAAEAERRLGPVDLLVNNAGVWGAVGPTWEADPEAWWRGVEVSLRGPFLCSRAVLPGMIARGRGRIINVASSAALAPSPRMTALSSAKAALLRLTDGLAEEVREYGIAVFAIHPGVVRTAMTEYLLDSPEGQRAAPRLGALPPEAWVTPARVGELCAFLASGRVDGLSGRYLPLADGVEQLANRADEIRHADRYRLRLHQ